MRKKPQSPVVNGVPTTYGNLAKALGLTRQGAKHRYDLAKKIHGKVKTAHIAQPVVPPDRGMLKMLRSEQEHNLRVVKFAMLHGPTHASIRFKMDVEDIKKLLRADKN